MWEISCGWDFECRWCSFRRLVHDLVRSVLAVHRTDSVLKVPTAVEDDAKEILAHHETALVQQLSVEQTVRPILPRMQPNSIKARNGTSIPSLGLAPVHQPICHLYEVFLGRWLLDKHCSDGDRHSDLRFFLSY